MEGGGTWDCCFQMLFRQSDGKLCFWHRHTYLPIKTGSQLQIIHPSCCLLTYCCFSSNLTLIYNNEFLTKVSNFTYASVKVGIEPAPNKRLLSLFVCVLAAGCVHSGALCVLLLHSGCDVWSCRGSGHWSRGDGNTNLLFPLYAKQYIFFDSISLLD